MLPKYIVYCTELKKVLIYSVCHDKSDSIMVTVIAITESGISGEKSVGDSHICNSETYMYVGLHVHYEIYEICLSKPGYSSD